MAKKKIQEQEQELELIMQMNREMVEEQEQVQENDSADSDVNAAAALPDEEELDENKKKNDDGNKSSQSKLTEEEKKKIQEEEEKKKKEEEKNKAAKKLVKNIGKNRLSSMNEIELAQYLLKLCYDPASLVTGEPGFENIDAVVRSFYQRFGQMDKTAQQYVENRFQFEVQRMSTSQQMVITNSAVKNALYDREAQNPTLLKDTMSFVTDEAIGTYDSTSTDFTSLHTIDALMSMGYKGGTITAVRDGEVVTINVGARTSVTTSKGREVLFTPTFVKGPSKSEAAITMTVDGENIDVVTTKTTDEGVIEETVKENTTFAHQMEEIEEKKEAGVITETEYHNERRIRAEENRNKISSFADGNEVIFAGGFFKGIDFPKGYKLEDLCGDMRAHARGFSVPEPLGGFFTELDSEGSERFRNLLKLKYEFKDLLIKGGIGEKLAADIVDTWNQQRGELAKNPDGRVTTTSMLASAFSFETLKAALYGKDEKTGATVAKYPEEIMAKVIAFHSQATQTAFMRMTQGHLNEMCRDDNRVSEIVSANFKQRTTTVEKDILNPGSILSKNIEIQKVFGKGLEALKPHEEQKTAEVKEEVPPLQHTELTAETMERMNQGANDVVNEAFKSLEKENALKNEKVAEVFKTNAKLSDKALDDIGRNDFRI